MKIQRILIGMDLSETAINAARWTINVFAPGAEVSLAHVIDPPDRPLFARHVVPSPDLIEAKAREYATTRLRELATSLRSKPIQCEIRVGKPHEQLVRLAEEWHADLLVVGPHGNRPRPSKFLGTTADRIVRTSPVPVLVATNPPSGRPRHLLVSVDDSEIAGAALTSVRGLADAFDAHVTLLHVWSNAVYSHVASMSYVTAETEAAGRAEIEKELRDAETYWLGEIAATGIRPERVTPIVRYGNAGDITVEMAASIKADLIVLGRHGSGLVAPALLGSTVGTVLHGARCPVLVVTEPKSSD